MDYQKVQEFADMIGANASVYEFDRLPDGSFSEIRMIAANPGFQRFFALNPNSPAFYPGIPYRKYFYDVNFESFCYKCASTGEALYSYVNAHGSWLSGHYLPVPCEKENTFRCCYILKVQREVESDVLASRSSEVSNAVLALSIKLHKGQDFVQAMAEAVGDIRKICDSEKCAIVLIDQQEKSCTFIDESGLRQEYMLQLAESMHRTPYEMVQAWEKALAGTDCFLLSEFSVVKERDPLWYDSLIAHHINSLVLYSLCFKRELVGFIWAANFDVNQMMRIKETLETSTFFISSVIANQQLLSRLEVMSMVDGLTQVRNRNAMNKRIDQLVSDAQLLPETIGVVFADLNGLKSVNDNEGHDAGDKLIRKAAALLRTVFGDYEIYRAGGDEFLIFCPAITQAELESSCAELRHLAEQTQDVSFAVGAGFFTGNYNIRQAMQDADALMYQDKQLYYQNHPEKKRRLT